MAPVAGDRTQARLVCGVLAPAASGGCRSGDVTAGPMGCVRDSADGRISVLLADDNLLVREGVRALLRLAGDFDVVATAENYDDIIAAAARRST